MAGGARRVHARRRAGPDAPAGAPDAGAYRLDGLRPLLPASLILWPGPRTYTGQPSAEIHTVGSPPLLQHLLAHCLTRGARPAEPGEFTLRAFLSGRIDLTRAEAVLGVIDARSPAQLDAALGQLAGGLASPIAALRDRLLDVLAHLEANLDFVDEPDVDPLGRLELAAEPRRRLGRDRRPGRPAPRPRPPRGPPPGRPRRPAERRQEPALQRPARPVAAPSSRPAPARPATTSPPPSTADGLTVELIDTAGEEPASSPIDARAQALRAAQSARADLLLVCVPADADAALARPTPTAPASSS